MIDSWAEGLWWFEMEQPFSSTIVQLIFTVILWIIVLTTAFKLYFIKWEEMTQKLFLDSKDWLTVLCVHVYIHTYVFLEFKL